MACKLKKDYVVNSSKKVPGGSVKEDDFELVRMVIPDLKEEGDFWFEIFGCLQIHLCAFTWSEELNLHLHLN